MWPLKMGTFHQSKFRSYSLDYFSLIGSHDIKKWFLLVLVCIRTKFGCCSILEIFPVKFSNVMWSRHYVTRHVGMVLFHADMYSYHTWWQQPAWKLRYDVFNVSRDHFITKCDKFLRKYLTYYKACQQKYDRLLLQSASGMQSVTECY